MPQVIESSGAHSEPAELVIGNLMQRVRDGESGSDFELREFLAKGIRWHLRRHSNGSELEPRVRHAVDAVMEAVAGEQVHTACEVLGLARAAAQTALTAEETAAHGGKGMQRPAKHAVETMKQVFLEMPRLERNALVRFYEGEAADRICEEFGLTGCEFKALKARAKQRYGELQGAADGGGLSRLAGWLHFRMV